MAESTKRLAEDGFVAETAVVMGSIAERVVQKAPCAVLTVRDADRRTAIAAA